jgi:hypothetical protein
MRLVIDDLDDRIRGPFYMDISLSADELDRIKSGEIISGCEEIQGKRFYIGILRQGRFFYDKEDIWEEGENQEGYD